MFQENRDFRKSMAKLFEMGFWNETLNQNLLLENKMDIAMTVEKLLENRSGNSTTTPAGAHFIDSQPAANSTSSSTPAHEPGLVLKAICGRCNNHGKTVDPKGEFDTKSCSR